MNGIVVTGIAVARQSDEAKQDNDHRALQVRLAVRVQNRREAFGHLGVTKREFADFKATEDADIIEALKDVSMGTVLMAPLRNKNGGTVRGQTGWIVR